MKKMSKKVISILLCIVMVIGTFAVAGVNIADFFTKAEAYTNTTIDAITQEWVVSADTSLSFPDRDIFYEIYANDYFDGHSEPTNLVIPGLGSSSNYTPQGMTYWEAKNWILISAYDDAAGSTGRPSCIYAIDVASGEFVALFYIYNSNGTANTSHGGGIAASEHNFYFADSGSNVSYVPLSELDVSEGTCKNITLKGTVSFSAELNGASTSYCCYDDGVLWVGNFYLDTESSYNTVANAAHNSMLLGYKLEGDSSQEEWDYLCGKYKNLITITKTSAAFNMDDYHANGSTNNSVSDAGTYKVYRNGDTIDIVGNVTKQGTGAWDMFGSVTLEASTTYHMEFTSTHPGNAFLITENWSAVHALTDRGGKCEMTEDGLYHYTIDFTTGVPAGGTVIDAGKYNVRFDAYKGDAKYDLFNVGETFTITDFKLTKSHPTNILNLSHTSINNGNFNYTITTNPDNSINIIGTATNSTGAEAERTSNYASLNLVEGETYTLSYIADNNLTDAYIFAPAGSCGEGNATHMRLVPQRGKSIGNGLYYYETTFTAGKRLAGYSGGDFCWPAEQSTNGSFTGTYTIRFDQDAIPANTTRNFSIKNLSVVKTSEPLKGDRIHFPGTAGYPTYVVAFPNTYKTTIKNGNQGANATHNFNRIQYAMVDNGRIYVSRSWSRNMTSDNYISELDIIDISLDVPGTYSLSIGGATRNDCYLVGTESIKQFHAPSMLEALCVVDDYLYMFTESAAYYYREYNGRGGNISTQPIDVVWKLDQYAVLGQDRKETVGGNNARSTAGYVDSYERINSLDELNYNDNYMIVYESDTKAANGNKILYALDSYGGFKDGLVPKNSSGTQANTADSIGMVGHPISKYALDGDVLKLNDVVSDDKDSLHWNLIGADTGAFRIENNDSYYGDYKNLYFGSRLMYMMNSEGTSSKLDHIKIKDNGDSTFSFYYSGDADYYLWCNDGSNSAYMEAYSDLYNGEYAFGGDNPETTDVESGSVKAYAGQVEKSGTFHSDAFAKHTANNSGNKTGEAVNAKYTKFSIYRRADDLSSSGKSGLSTDLSAELQADGTYTITLESYSTGQTITKKSTDGKPIDFVFVLDASGSMNTNYDVPYMGRSDNPEPYSYDIANKDNGRALKYQGAYYYFDRYKSGDYSNAAIKVGSDFYSIGANSSFFKGGNAGNAGIKGTANGFAGGFYWVNRKGDQNRLEAMKQSTIEFIHQIEEHAKKTGIQHRIAIVQYGSTSYLGGRTNEDENFNNTGFYSTVSGTNMTNFGTLCTDKTNRTFTGFGNNIALYENAFYPANHDNLEQIVRGISVSGDPDTFVDHGMEMAMNILGDQMTNFNMTGDKTGDRIYGTYGKPAGSEGSYTAADVNAKACIINITDGVPGYGSDDGDAAYCSAVRALEISSALKNFGVDIYTVRLGNDSGDLNNENFLRALSSEYLNGSATSKYHFDSNGNRLENTLNMGTASGKTGYYIHHNLSSQLELDGLFDQITSSNDILEVETVQLGSDSVTLQSLGDTFKLTDASVATAKTSQIYYDSLGRIYEETPVDANYSITKNVTNNTVQLTGFDYSKEYVADGNAGKKLYLQIDGVLLNPAKADEFSLNLPISNDAKTAIYANSSAVSSGTATQYFPQAYFEVPTINYVYDYGLSMVNSSLYGTPISFDTVPDKQVPASTSVNISGDAAIGYNGSKVTSNIAPTCNSARESYVLLQKPNNAGYYWARVNMIPASNVYYEEGFSVPVTTDFKDWSSTGTTAGLTQSISGSSDVYGYDAAYANSKAHSNGTSKFVSIGASDKRSETQKFTFTGTGFDLISACGTTTGIQTVTVKQGNSIKKVFVVDTYYNDSAYGTIYQVPIVHFEGAYGTYTVETTATYLSKAGALHHGTVASNSVEGTDLEIQSAPTDAITAEEIFTQVGMEELIGADVELVWMDDNSILNGGTGAEGENLSTQADGAVTLDNYFDGFRVYNPMQDQSSYIASEQDVTYVNLVNNLANTSNGIFTDIKDIFAYVEGATFGEASFANYSKKGPQNELYLANGSTGVSFKVNLPEGARVMLGARAVSGAPKLTVNGNAIAINSATEMYYDITKYLTATNGVATVAITNSGTGLLAVNNMKLVGATTASVSTQSLDESVALMSLRPVDVEYTLPEEEKVVSYPGSEPVRNVKNPDPLLDIDVEIVDGGSSDGDNQANNAFQMIVDTLSKLLNNLLSRILEFIRSIVAAFSSIKF